MEAKKIINSLQKRGLKGSIQRFRQGPQKVGLVDFWSFITDREVTEFNFEDFKKHKAQYMAKDKEGRDVFLADSQYMLHMAQENYKKLIFHFTSEF